MAGAGTGMAATLQVVVDNVRNATGNVRVAVCSQGRFLGTSCEYVAQLPARPGRVVVPVDVPPGTWAVQAYHDENANEQVDRNLLGIPTEGLGFSNDARFRFGPPRWSDAQFRLGPNGGQVSAPLHYF